MQINFSVFDQLDNMSVRKWLLGNPCSQQAEHDPTKARDNGRRTEPRTIQQ
jgi:hypothetical protein